MVWDLITSNVILHSDKKNGIEASGLHEILKYQLNEGERVKGPESDEIFGYDP
jgi:hypothetical protein